MWDDADRWCLLLSQQEQTQWVNSVMRTCILIRTPQNGEKIEKALNLKRTFDWVTHFPAVTSECASVFKVGSAGWSVGTGRHLVCDVCSAARWGSARGPDRNLREGRCRTSSETHTVTSVRRQAKNPERDDHFMLCFWEKRGTQVAGAQPYLVSVPVVGRGVDSLPPVSLQQLLRVPDTHGASDNLPDIGHQYVHLKHTGLNLLLRFT